MPPAAPQPAGRPGAPNAPPGPQWNFIAAVAAWLLPGAGHYFIGEKQRGAILGATIGVLWLTGFAIGGIGVLDRADHPMWFFGQMLTAPSVAADLAVQRIKAGNPMPLPGKSPAYEPAFGRVSEQGILYTALAGLLNLLAMIDVLYRDPSRHRRDAAPTPAGGAGR